MQNVVNYKWTDECMSIIDFLTLIKGLVVYDFEWWEEYQACLDLGHPYHGWESVVGREYVRRMRLTQDYGRYRAWWRCEGLRPRSSSCSVVNVDKSR